MLQFTSKIISGHGVGRELGYPTLNFEVPEDLELELGVYACRAEINDQNLDGILFFGPRVTFEDGVNSLEVHLFDYPTGFAIENAKITVLDKIRKAKKFVSKEKLVEAIRTDCETVRRLLKSN